MKKILIYGPTLATIKNAYGGGMGGYRRKMQLYLNYFKSEKFKLIPSTHSIRDQFKIENFVIRFFIDMVSFFKSIIINRPFGIHILGQYRTATPREFMIVLFSKILGLKIIYEIKAGVFVKWYNETSRINQKMIHFVLRKSNIVLAQGMPYVDFLRDKLKISSYYHPNFVPMKELPDTIPEIDLSQTLKILFVGYAYKDKGVFELVDGLKELSSQVPNIELTLIGKEHLSFSEYLDTVDTPSNLKINRLGVLSHNEIMGHYLNNDIYCYPTRHKGEGHNNTINEAMMCGMIIITTKIGFLDTVIGNDRGYFLEESSAKEVQKVMLQLYENPEEARAKAVNARRYLMNHFTSDVAFKKLESYYSLL